MRLLILMMLPGLVLAQGSTAVIDIDGTSNILWLEQTQENKLLDLTVDGSNSEITVEQTGPGHHSAHIRLEGGNWVFLLEQSSSAPQQYGTAQEPAINICNSLGSCELNVYQP